MFNKSKKYCIVKCLPFVCFANINATEKFISKEGQIKVVVNGEDYVLQEGVEISNDKSIRIDVRKILGLANVWKKGDAADYKSSLPVITEAGYELVSYTLNGTEVKNIDDGFITNLQSITYENITDGLTINFESVYKLTYASLMDGNNIIDMGGKEFLHSDLEKIKDLNSLKKVIEKNCKDCESDNKGEGILKNLKIADNALDNLYVSNYFYINVAKVVVDGKITGDIAKEIVNGIKNNKRLALFLKKYIDYTIGNITLSEELAKTRKLKDDISDFKTACNGPLKKQLKKLTLTEIGTIIKGVSDYKDIDIKNDDPAGKIEEGKVDLVITAANDKISQLMKGTIKFEIDHTKDIQYDSHTFAGNNIDVIFGKKIKDEDIYAVIDTSTNQDIFKGEIKKYLGNIEAKEETYSINFASNFGTNNTDTAKDDFVVVVTFKGKVNGFTKEKDKEIENINIKLDIDDNASCDFQLETGLQKNYNSLAFNKNLDYNNFITELEKKLGKGTGLSSAIKSVTYNNTNDWKSNSTVKIENTIKCVTIVLNKAENSFVKRVVKTTPPASGNVTFKLNLSTSVKGYKIKDNKTEITVTVSKAGINYNTLFNAIQSQIGDNKFKIMKGSSAISDSEIIDIINPNAYSIELEVGSSLLDKNKKEDDEETRNTEDKEGTEQQKGKSNKRCCNCKEGCNCKKN